MDRQHRLLPVLASATALAWMAAVLFIAANPKELSVAGDLAYDSANRLHTLALLLLLVTAFLIDRMIRAGGLPGGRAAKTLLVGAVLMLVGNVVSFWGALLVGQQSDQFWGGLVGWIVFVPGLLLLIGAPIGLARAARQWRDVSSLQRWSIGLFGLLFGATTGTWAISPMVTLVPAVLAAFALLLAATAVTHATPSRDSEAGPVPSPA